MRLRHLAATLATLALCTWSVASPAQGLHGVRGSWVDDRNRPYPMQSLRGSFAVVSMAYGACRRVCAANLRVLEQLQRLADERKAALNFVVFGLDPSQDRPADWAAYRAERKLTRANWHFLVGDRAAIAPMAQWLGVRYWFYGEHVMHDFRIVLVSPEGQVVASMTMADQDLAALLP